MQDVSISAPIYILYIIYIIIYIYIYILYVLAKYPPDPSANQTQHQEIPYLMGI